MRLLRTLTPLLVGVGSIAPVQSGWAQSSWPQFRGPGGQSLAEGRLPQAIGPDANVLWQATLPAGQSSPCIVGDLIVLTGQEGEATVVVVGLDRATGKVRWRRSFEGEPHPDYMHPDAAPATPTPCTDGKRIVSYFGNYGLVTLDLEGELLWEKRLPHPGYGFGVGNSPILAAGAVVLPRDGAPEAAILCFDVEDGSELWTIDRFDYGESHGSPYLWRNSEREELVIGGTLRLCSFDPMNGELLWSYEGTTVFPCTTPVGDEDTLYFAAWSTSNASGRSFWDAGFGRSLELSDAEVEDQGLLFSRLDQDGNGKVTPDEVPECRAKDAFGFIDQNQNGTWEREELSAPPSGTGNGANLMVVVPAGLEGKVSDEDLRWTATRGLPYVSSPLLYEGRIWLFKAGGIVTCLDAKSGEPCFRSSRLPDRSEYYMSPVGVDGRILIGSAEGTLFLIDSDADELVIEHTATFEEGLFATPAVLEGTVYLRTSSRLWAFRDGE